MSADREPHPVMGEIRRIRREGHLTQDDVALVLGIDRKTVNRWERGHYPPNLLLTAAYADLLGYEITLRRKLYGCLPEEITPAQAARNRAVLARVALGRDDDYEPSGPGGEQGAA